MTVDNTALPGIALAVVTVALLVAALMAGETVPRSRAFRVLAGGSVASAVACLALIALRFVSVL